MRIVVALGETRLEVDAAAAALAALAQEHEVLVVHGAGQEASHALELALRNRLPERDVLSVLTQVVVADDDHEPCAVAEAPSLRTLIGSGALILCAGHARTAVAVSAEGNLTAVGAPVDEEAFAALLARRLDADLILKGNEVSRLVTLAG